MGIPQTALTLTLTLTLKLSNVGPCGDRRDESLVWHSCFFIEATSGCDSLSYNRHIRD